MNISSYDSVAHSFDLHRPLPEHVPSAIRTAVLDAANAGLRPRLLDIGSGTGRIGRAFVAANDDYVAVDLSLGMLHEFVRWGDRASFRPALLQADGRRLPFRENAFDAVLLIQVVGAAEGWQALVEEARRVLRPAGALVIGRTVTPEASVDAQMKHRLATVLQDLGVPSHQMKNRAVLQHSLETEALTSTRTLAATWVAERSPSMFLSRQRTGARFSRLPLAVQATALRNLSEWAIAHFGSLDAAFSEQHAFELHMYRF